MNQLFAFWTFRTKLISGIFLVGLVAVGILVALRAIEFHEFSHARDLEYFRVNGQSFAKMIGRNIARNEDEELRYHIQLALLQPDVKMVSAVGPDGVVLYSSDSSLAGKSNTHRDSPDIVHVQKGWFFKSFDMTHDGKEIGSLQMAYSLERTHGEQSKVLWSTIFVGFFVLILVALAAGLISGYIRTPLRRMQDISKQFAKGDFSSRLPVMQTNDEIGSLGISLNEMADQLQELTNDMQRKIDLATSELRLSNEKLKELDKLKSHFVSMVSHDLKNPLSAIIIGAETLLSIDALAPDVKKDLLQVIQKEGIDMAAMINKFLDLTKIESGHFEVSFQPVSIEDVIAQAGTTLRVGKKAIIKQDIAEDMPLIMADPDLLRILLMNIMENAVKYSGEKKEIVITAKMESEMVRVSIADNGPGIPAEDREKAFERFFRGKDAKSSHGTGLGLASAKSIVEAHRGKIWCDSEMGIGTTISFTLPKDVTGGMFEI